MSGHYDKSGVAFQYPENWVLEEGDEELGNRSISVASPETGAYWAVSLHPNANNPARLVEAVAEAFKGEYDDLETHKVTVTIEDTEMQGLDVHFFCGHFTSTARVLAFRDHRNTCVLVWQTADQEMTANSPVFEAITTSFMAERRPKS